METGAMLAWATWLLLALMLVGIARTLARLRRQQAADLLLVTLLTGVAAWLRFRLMPFHHAMYVDEPWYEEAARNLLRAGRLALQCSPAPQWTCEEPYIKAAGWPAILAVAFQIAGPTDATAFHTTALLGVLAVPAVFFVVRAAGGGSFHGLLAATLLALHPVHVQWSTTAETNVAAVTLLLTGLGGTVWLTRERTWAALLMAVGGLGAAAAVRPELWLAFLPAAPVLLQRSWQSALVLVGAAVAAVPGIASRGAFSVHSKGELFQLSSLATNLREWLASPHELGPFTAVILLLALIGAVRMFVAGKREVVLVLGGTALLIGGFVLLYYPPAGFYSRTMLGALAPAIALAGLHVSQRKPFVTGGAATLAALALASWVWSARDEWARVSDSQLSETRFAALAQQARFPSGATILAEQPAVLRAMSDLNVMAIPNAEEASALPQGQPLYLACDMYCEPRFGGDEESGCARLLRHYVVEPAFVIDGVHRNYGFFKVVRRSDVPIEQPMCPLLR